jgi:hypothetical protein
MPTQVLNIKPFRARYSGCHRLECRVLRIAKAHAKKIGALMDADFAVKLRALIQQA